MPTTQTIAKYLQKTSQTLATAESCTGGLISHTLTNVSGSSGWFKGGVIAYANEIKTGFLGVPAPLIKAKGAVCRDVALAMAKGIRQRMTTDFGIGITGIAGPTGGSAAKPVGLVFMAAASPTKAVVKKFIFKGTRVEIKQQAAREALCLLTSLF